MPYIAMFCKVTAVIIRKLYVMVCSGRSYMTVVILIDSPGMPEMLSPSAALVGSGLGAKVALATDGRFSGATHGEH